MVRKYAKELKLTAKVSALPLLAQYQPRAWQSWQPLLHTHPGVTFLLFQLSREAFFATPLNDKMNWLRLDPENNELHSSSEARRHLSRMPRKEPLSLIAIFGDPL